MPCVRHRSATFRPASPSLTIARICSSVNLLRFIGPPLKSEDLILRGADYWGQVTGTVRATSRGTHSLRGGAVLGIRSVMVGAGVWLLSAPASAACVPATV